MTNVLLYVRTIQISHLKDFSSYDYFDLSLPIVYTLHYLLPYLTGEKGLKKHILCYSRCQRQSSDEAITEIYLVNASKLENVPTGFTSVR